MHCQSHFVIYGLSLSSLSFCALLCFFSMAQQQAEEHGVIGNSSHVDTRVEHMAARWFVICCLELRGAASFATGYAHGTDAIYDRGLVSFDSGEA
eukprot:COSAG03_NODE_5288_length_1286_cov_0.775906_2_plen_94_part_01